MFWAKKLLFLTPVRSIFTFTNLISEMYINPDTSTQVWNSSHNLARLDSQVARSLLASNLTVARQQLPGETTRICVLTFYTFWDGVDFCKSSMRTLWFMGQVRSWNGQWGVKIAAHRYSTGEWSGILIWICTQVWNSSEMWSVEWWKWNIIIRAHKIEL